VWHTGFMVVATINDLRVREMASIGAYINPWWLVEIRGPSSKVSVWSFGIKVIRHRKKMRGAAPELNLRYIMGIW